MKKVLLAVGFVACALSAVACSNCEKAGDTWCSGNNLYVCEKNSDGDIQPKETDCSNLSVTLLGFTASVKGTCEVAESSVSLGGETYEANTSYCKYDPDTLNIGK